MLELSELQPVYPILAVALTWRKIINSWFEVVVWSTIDVLATVYSINPKG